MGRIASSKIPHRLQPEMRATHKSLTAAVTSGSLLESARTNIIALLDGTTSEIPLQAVKELVTDQAWDELNDRFFKKFNTVSQTK